ncbi:MAG: hypothetical protein KAJ86_04725 [Alphaproteobacteria bacterium]|nr:hypothetical protein [Alphaproteobacteria bacterium]
MEHELIKGFHKFREKEYKGKKPLMTQLIEEGQSPKYFIISCIDSRCHPGAVFHAKPGTFLAHKAMGAIVRPYKKDTPLAASLQFGLEHNNVSEIIVLGHTRCGAIKALLNNAKGSDIRGFLSMAQNGIKTAKRKCGENPTLEELRRKAEEEIIIQSAKNLTKYPSVRKALKKGRATIKIWMFDMEEGNILEYQTDKKIFKALTNY